VFMACLAADISGSSVLAGQLSIIDVRLAVEQAVGRICRGRGFCGSFKAQGTHGSRRVLTQDLRSYLSICQQDGICRSVLAGVIQSTTAKQNCDVVGEGVVSGPGLLAVLAKSVVLWVHEWKRQGWRPGLSGRWDAASGSSSLFLKTDCANENSVHNR